MPNVVVVTKMILPQAPTPSCASTTSCRFPRRMSTIFHHLARSQNAQLDGPRTITRNFSHSSFYRWLGLIVRLDEPTDIEIRRKKNPMANFKSIVRATLLRLPYDCPVKPSIMRAFESQLTEFACRVSAKLDLSGIARIRCKV